MSERLREPEEHRREAEPALLGGLDRQSRVTARRLTDDGYLSTRAEPAKTRPRTIYELTDKGHEAIRAWLAEPSVFPRIQHEAAIRLYASDLGDTAAVLARTTRTSHGRPAHPSFNARPSGMR
jgi:hypothetical protein